MILEEWSEGCREQDGRVAENEGEERVRNVLNWLCWLKVRQAAIPNFGCNESVLGYKDEQFRRCIPLACVQQFLNQKVPYIHACT